MSRQSLVIISRMIVVVVFITSILALALGDFFVTLITVSGGLIIWLLYLLAADLGTAQDQSGRETSPGKGLSKVVAGLGGVLAISAFTTYGLEQTMWGGYTFNLAGLALALAVLVVMLLPLVVLQLISRRPAAPAVPPIEKPAAALPEAPPPEPAAAVPEQQLYYGPPYPPTYEPYREEDYLDYDTEEEGEAEGAEEDYYEEEEASEYQEDEEEEDEEDEEEDTR